MIPIKGLLMGMMEPPAGFEEEFQDWYDTEHTPKVRSVQGFETGRRFVCLSGWPRYVALYDLTTLAVLSSPEYQKKSDQGISPWSLRVRSKMCGRYRFTGTQIYPGTAKLGDQGAVIRLLVLRFRDVTPAEEPHMLAGLRANFDGRVGVSQLRFFRGEEKATGDYAATVEFHSNACSVDIDPAPFGTVIKNLDLINTYATYWRMNRP